MNTSQTTIKTAFEIGSLAGKLNRRNQSYVLNTINALLFSQQLNESEDKKNINEKSAISTTVCKNLKRNLHAKI